MEQKKFKDIVAFKGAQNEAPFAFHARNLEIAEISEQAWNDLSNPAIVSEANQALANWNTEINPDVKSGTAKFGIRTLTLNVTQICNLKCVYCAAGGDGTYGAPQTKINIENTLPQLKWFLNKVPAGEQFSITFLGGEPLLYPEGIEAVGNYVNSVATEKNIKARFSIVTNGTLLNDRNINILKMLKANVTVSLDGPAEINDKVRPRKNGEGSTIAAIEGIKQLAEDKTALGVISVHGVFDKNNLNLVGAYEFYKTLAVDSYGFTYSVEENDEHSNKVFIEQMNQIAEKAYADGGEAELRKISFFDQHFSALDNQQQTENFCGAGKSYLMIDAKNAVFTCPWDVGNKEEQIGHGHTLNQEKLSNYSKPLIEQNNCQTCWARYLCGGGCMFMHKKSSGSKNTKDPQFCFRTRSLLATVFLYYIKCRIPAS